MKKFSKLLVLILSLVMLITAFTVVALATDEEPSRSTPYIKDAVGTWEGETVKDGTAIGTGTSGKRPAYVFAQVSADGNKYEVYTPSPDKGTGGDNWYDNIGDLPSGTVTKANGDSTKKVGKYNLSDYPYFVYDFDVMTPTGNFGRNSALSSFSVRAYAYYYTDNEYGYNENYKAGAVRDTGDCALDIPVEIVFSKLDSTPYNWQHVTIAARAYSQDGKICFEILVYVNGEFVNSTTTTAPTKFNGKLLEDISHAQIRQSANKNLTYAKALVDFTGYVASDPTTWPDSDPSEWYEDKVAFDNPSFSYYQADWDFDSIAKESWERTKDNVPAKSAKSVASLTKADGTILYFGDINAAIAAAQEGETITLLADITTTAKVDKAITVDAGMHYKHDGVDYLLGTHEFPYYSSNGMYATLDADTGLYNFTQYDDLYYIEWDPACEGECDCLDGYAHIYSSLATGIVGKAILNPVGVKQVDYEIINGYDVDFLGWSLTKGGEVIDLSTLAPAAGETIKLYPIYKAVQYNLQVITSAGKVFYYTEDEFVSAVEKASGGTVKLMTDVYTECPTMELTSSLVIDLNGYNLNRCYVYGNIYEATEDGNGGYVYTETVLSTTTSNPYLFVANNSDRTLTITSGVGGGSLSAVSMKADIWKCGDEVVKVTPTGFMKGNALLNANSKSRVRLYVNGGINLNIFGIYQQVSASVVDCVVDFNNVNFTHITANEAPTTSSGMYKYMVVMLSNKKNYINFTDCVLNFPYTGAGVQFMALRTANKSMATESDMMDVVFKNTDIIKSHTSYSGGYYVQIKVDSSTTYGNAKYVNVIYDNCRAYDLNHNGFSADYYTTHVGINGTKFSDEKSDLSYPRTGEGHEVVAKSYTHTYTVVQNTKFTVDSSSDIQKIDFSLLVPKTYSVTFNKIITRPVDVNYVDGNGSVVKTEQLRPGVDAIPESPVVSFPLESDPYRNILAQWADEDGKALGTTLGLDGVNVNWQDEYNFYAVPELDGVTKYTGGLKDILFNISFTSSFRYNVYLPEYDKNITINGVSVFNKGTNVKVDGYEYAVYSFVAGTATASDDTVFVINFTYDGVEYEQTVKVNALLYANIILATSDLAEEKLAVGNMARFIMEARKTVGEEVDEAKFNAIIVGAGVKDYSDDYKGNTDIGNLYEYLYSVSYVIYNGNASYKFVLNDASYVDVLNFKLGDKALDINVVGTQTIGGVEKTYVILDTARVYDIIDALTITVEGTDLSATYSMLDNIEANPTSDLLKSLYEFGLAAESYRAYLQANY